MIRAVLLDVDDTLVDTRGAFRHALTVVGELHLPGPVDSESLVTTWRTDAGGWYRAFTRGEVSYREQRMRRANALHDEYGGPVLDGEAYDAWNLDFEAAFRAGWVAHPDAVPMLDALDAAGIVYGAVSNAATDYQRLKLDTAGLQRVPMLVGTDTFGVGKPAPRVFLEGARLLGAEPGATAYVGDEPDIDASAALAAGLAAGVWLARPGAHGSEGETPAGVVRIGSLAELHGALGR